MKKILTTIMVLLSSQIAFADQIWLAAMGPGIQSEGVPAGHWQQSQIAATALAVLPEDPRRHITEADAPIMELLASK